MLHIKITPECLPDGYREWAILYKPFTKLGSPLGDMQTGSRQEQPSEVMGEVEVTTQDKDNEQGLTSPRSGSHP